MNGKSVYACRWTSVAPGTRGARQMQPGHWRARLSQRRAIRTRAAFPWRGPYQEPLRGPHLYRAHAGVTRHGRAYETQPAARQHRGQAPRRHRRLHRARHHHGAARQDAAQRRRQRDSVSASTRPRSSGRASTVSIPTCSRSLSAPTRRSTRFASISAPIRWPSFRSRACLRSCPRAVTAMRALPDAIRGAFPESFGRDKFMEGFKPRNLDKPLHFDDDAVVEKDKDRAGKRSTARPKACHVGTGLFW